MNSSKQRLLTDLPQDIYYSFQDYLTQDDYQQLLNTSQKFFLKIRKKTIIYHLTEKYSIKYCDNENFRNELIEKVENPLKQIKIKVPIPRIKRHEDLFDRLPVHVKCTSFVEENPTISLRNVKEFTLHDYEFPLATILNVSQCENANFIDCPGIIDISLLKDCTYLTFIKCDNITDFSSLGKQRSLFIRENARLTNAINFRSIRTVIFECCQNLQDVSALHGVYDLSLRWCLAISDISSLGGHHRLEISNLNSMLSGYHALKDIPIVTLAACNLSDASVLSNAKIVCLEKCNSLVDVSPLRGVRVLTLRDCASIEDISMLTTVQKLTLHKLPCVQDCEAINEMTNLHLEVTDLQDGMVQKFVKAKITLTFNLLTDFSFLSSLTSFTNLHSLTVCSSSVKVEVCIDIHTVILEKCKVENICGLGKNRVVRLFRCRGSVLDVSNLATVPVVSIIHCQFEKVNYESLKNVPRLKIEELVY